MEDIDYEFTDEIVCPYCGYKFNDSWEMGTDDIDQDCPECGKHFSWSTDVTVKYISEKDCKLNKEEHVWMIVTTASGTYEKCSKCGHLNYKRDKNGTKQG